MATNTTSETLVSRISDLGSLLIRGQLSPEAYTQLLTEEAAGTKFDVCRLLAAAEKKPLTACVTMAFISKADAVRGDVAAESVAPEVAESAAPEVAASVASEVCRTVLPTLQRQKVRKSAQVQVTDLRDAAEAGCLLAVGFRQKRIAAVMAQVMGSANYEQVCRGI